jgi:Ca-activated chloride channel family protein
MFLEDERAAGRLRASRVSLSLMVAVIAFASCVVAAFGLFSVAEAGPAMASSSLHASYADQKIADGVAVLFAALVAANGLAIWLRRIKGLVLSGGRRDAR